MVAHKVVEREADEFAFVGASGFLFKKVAADVVKLVKFIVYAAGGLAFVYTYGNNAAFTVAVHYLKKVVEGIHTVFKMYGQRTVMFGNPLHSIAVYIGQCYGGGYVGFKWY